MNEVGAIGDLVQSAAMARALEPGAGDTHDGHTHETKCLNCRTTLLGDYCHGCGQHAHVHRTLGAFFHDLLHGVFHFEGKIWRTVPLLAWRPGDLTRRYIDGQRASFVSPIALFLFSVFLMFAVVGMTGNLNPNLGKESNLAKSEQNTLRELGILQKQRAERLAKGKTTLSVDNEIKDTQESLEVIRALRTKGITSAVLSSHKTDLDTDVPFLAEAYSKAKENPQLLLYKLKSNSYKWSWALIPLSVPFLWLLFPFSRKFRLYDHVVFVTYSLCFMSLLVSLGTFASFVGISAVAAPMLFVPPIHMYRQLRGAYRLGRFGALWRSLVLTIAAVIVLTLFVLGMVALGVLD